MRKKHIIVQFVILIFLVSCSIKNDRPENKKDDLDLTQKENVDERILGDWGIYSSFSGSSQIHCNSCPQIKFISSLKAQLTYPNEEKEYYEWKVIDNQLILDFQKGIDNRRHFQGKSYKMEFDDTSKLKLYSSPESGYNLGRR